MVALRFLRLHDTMVASVSSSALLWPARLAPRMQSYSTIFKTPKGQAEYLAAYDRSLSLWPVAYDSLDVPTSFGKTHVLTCGPRQAPPLILLHVMSFSSTMWYPNIADLSQSYRIYALDTIGDVGRSIPCQPVRNRFAYVQWLDEVLDGLGIEKAFVLGESYGGWLCLNLAGQRPERIQAIAVLSPAAGFLMYSLRADLRFGLTLFPRFNAQKYWQWVMGERHQVEERFAEQLSLAKHYKPLGWPVIPMALSDDELRRIRVPTLLLIGEHEVTNDPHKAIERAKRLISNLETELIPNAGHIMNIEEPEIVDQRVLSFFARNNPLQP